MKSSTIAVMIALCSAGSASAIDIWATDNLGENNGGSIGDRIIRFDSLNPANPTVIGETGISGTLMGGLDFTPDGRLYAYAQTGQLGLYQIDQTDGSATRIGNQSGSDVTDLSWNPATGQMHAISIFGGQTTYGTIDMTTGAYSSLGNVQGIAGLEVGLAHRSDGTPVIHDLVNDAIYTLDGGFNATMVIDLPFDTNFSQGMTIDWSRDDAGYHGALNAGTFRTELWKFDTVAGVTNFVGNIGGINPNGLPEYETGDVAILPIPAPGALALLGAAGLAAARRRRA
jgi:hypothetical protein